MTEIHSGQEFGDSRPFSVCALSSSLHGGSDARGLWDEFVRPGPTNLLSELTGLTPSRTALLRKLRNLRSLIFRIVLRNRNLKRKLPGRFFRVGSADLGRQGPFRTVGWRVRASLGSLASIRSRVADSGRLGRVRAGDLRRDGRVSGIETNAGGRAAPAPGPQRRVEAGRFLDRRAER